MSAEAPLAGCAMCGLPVSNAQTRSDEPVFCCPGCSVVYSVWHESDDGGHERVVQTAMIVRFAVSAFLAMNVMMFSMALYGERWYGDAHGFAPEAVRGFFRWIVFGFSVPAIWLLGMPQVRAVVSSATGLNRVYHGLVLVSVGAALAVSLWALFTGVGDLYFDTVVMLLLLVTLGRLLEGSLRAKAGSEVRQLLASSQRLWTIQRDGQSLERHAEELAAGDVLQIRPGDRVPVDGRIVEGRSEVTSESRDGSLTPRGVEPGGLVRSGELNLRGVLHVGVAASDARPFWNAYCDLARQTLQRPAEAERMAARVSAILLPTTIVLSIATLAAWWVRVDATTALLHALSVLMVACPCAMGLATPVALRLAVGESMRRGAMPRSSDVFERMARVDRLVVDHTGTMTQREGLTLHVMGTSEISREARDMLRALARSSSHPMAQAVAAWCGDGPERNDLMEVEEVAGRGLCATLGGRRVMLGSATFLRERGVELPDDLAAAAVAFAHDGKHVASFSADLPLHPATLDSLRRLAEAGLPMSLMTGASSLPDADSDIKELFDTIRLKCTPADKVAAIEEFKRRGETVAMIGDGLNDLPALAAADVGVAIGVPETVVGSTADIVVLGGGLAALPFLFGLSRRTMRVVRWNYIWVIGYNGVALAAAAVGALHPLLAGAMMTVSSALIVAHSFTLRTLPAFYDSSDRSNLR